MEPEQQIMEFTNLLLEAMKLAIKIANDREIEKFNLTNATMANVGNVQGITAQFTDGTNVSPTIYPSQYMEAYQNGTSIDELAQRAIQTLKDGHNAMPTFDVESINPENAQSQLYMVILNKEMNKEIAEKCPHIEIQDLIAVPRWRVSQGDGEQASILVTHDIQSRLLHMTDDEVCGIAKSNTLSEGFTVQGITEVMMQIMGGDMPEEFLADMLPEEEPMFVVSNASKMNGATALLDSKTLEAIKETIHEENYYLIGSSIHEVLVVPESKVNDPADLKEMCEQVNATEVSPADRLTDNIYRYDGKTHKLQICNNLEQLRQQTQLADLGTKVANSVTHTRRV